MEEKRHVGRPRKDEAVKRAQKKNLAGAAGKTEKKRTGTARKSAQGDIIFALDIGTNSVVGVLARKTQKGCEIIDMEQRVHNNRCMNDGQIEDIKAVSADIKIVRSELEKRNSVSLTKACVAAAGRALKTVRSSWEYNLAREKHITEEILRAAELDSVRRTCADFSAQNGRDAFYCVGHSVVSLTLDGFKIKSAEGHRGEKLVTELIAAFLPAFVVESLCAAVDGAGIDVQSITLEPIAAMNAIIPQELRLINLALCDIGAGTSDVAASKDGSVTAYGMATYAGDEITEAIMKSLLVDFETAERIKISEEKEISYRDVLFMEHKVPREKVEEIIRPASRELARVIADEIINANITAPQAVFLVGGGSKLPGLAKMVAEELKIDESRVILGRRELLRGFVCSEKFALGAEHTTPLGIAISAGSGVSYDFTSVTVNGKRLRALDTSRLTVFELLSFAKIKPESLMAGSGEPLSYTLSGEKITIRGGHASPSEIIVNGEAASLNTVVQKGDEVTVIPAVKGENASAKLSDHFDFSTVRAFYVTAFGEKVRAGRFISVNGKETVTDRKIHEGDVIELADISTLGALVKRLSGENDAEDELLINGRAASKTDALKSGDIITKASPFAEVKKLEVREEAPKSEEKTEERPAGVSISVNGISSVFPLREDGRAPIFLDVAAAFCDNPTDLLAHAATITINGKIARLDEEIREGDVIIIE